MNTIKKPTVSVIIPVYNVQDYICTAIDSVLSQTTAPDEIIIVDDGSTDNSGALVEEKYGHISYVKIVHTKNQGLGEARNVGTRIASGDFIYYFDSDDILNPELLSTFQIVWENNPNIDLFVFSAESFFDTVVKSTDNNAVSPPCYLRNMEKTYPTGREAFNSLSRLGTFYPNAWIYMFRRAVQVENALFFKPIIHEDEEFTPRLFFKSNKTVVTNKVFFRRRVRPGSIMQTRRSEGNIIGYIESITALSELIKINNGESKRFLRARLRNNMLNIILILRDYDILLSPLCKKKIASIFEEHDDFLMKIARRNVFLFRCVRCFFRRVGVYL